MKKMIELVNDMHMMKIKIGSLYETKWRGKNAKNNKIRKKYKLLYSSVDTRN